MYERPVHHIYDLGYNSNPDPFPAATYVAQRLMVLPTHPFLRDTDLRGVSEALHECFGETRLTKADSKSRHKISSAI
jgi:dTDP-4-amino-4,6-dideoxygalactose transaminase